MKLVPTAEERDLAAMLRDLLARECPTSLVRQLAEPGAERFPKALWASLVSAGVLGLPFAEEYGGSDGTLDDLGVFHVEAGRSLCPTIVTSTVSFGLAVDALADATQRSALLPGVASGDLRGTVAVTDPADASDVRPLATARPVEGDPAGAHVVAGILELVFDADLADSILLTADVVGEQRVVGLVVDSSDAGVHIDPVPTIGGPGCFRVTLDDVVVPADAVLGGVTGVDDEALRRLAHTIGALQCLELVGVAEAALARTVEHITSRRQFDRPIGSFQAAQHLVADMHIAVQGAGLAARSAVFRLGRGEPGVRACAVARMHATTAAKHVTLDAHQLHGGMGYVLETDLHLWSARARQLATVGGTADTAARWLEQEVGLV